MKYMQLQVTPDVVINVPQDGNQVLITQGITDEKKVAKYLYCYIKRLLSREKGIEKEDIPDEEAIARINEIAKMGEKKLLLLAYSYPCLPGKQ